MPSEHHQEYINIIDRLARIETNLTTLVATQKALDTHLFGNGRAGVIEQLEDRIGSLEGWKWWTHGIWAAIAAVLAVVGNWLGFHRGGH